MSLLKNVVSLQDAIEIMRERLQALQEESMQGWFRFEIAIETIDPLDWLQHQSVEEKFYWRDRGDEFAMAGIGLADYVDASHINDTDHFFETLRSLMGEHSKNLRYYGGLAFNQDEKESQVWGDFPKSCFVVPAIEVFRGHEATFLACNILLKEGDASTIEKMQSFLGQVVSQSLKKEMRPFECLQRRDLPEREQWLQNINYVLRHIEQGPLKKAVMARVTTIECDQSLDVLSILEKLRRSTEDCFHFCFQFSQDKAFIGATPERLYQRKERYIRSEALAGTRPRGKTDAEDRLLSIELLSSRKDIREHRFVVEQIHQDLEPFCQSLNVNREVSLIKLKRGQHLFSGIKGLLLADVRDADLLNVLHPTPAIGGTPRAEAVEVISEREPFERGWYSGPIGWVGLDAVEFAVAIRSGLIEGAKMHLFSGAGIVQGSSPEEEWNEIENKIANFMEMVE